MSIAGARVRTCGKSEWNVDKITHDLRTLVLRHKQEQTHEIKKRNHYYFSQLTLISRLRSPLWGVVSGAAATQTYLRTFPCAIMANGNADRRHSSHAAKLHITL
eukprot:6214362-Pleurochrysis_carterae.AAC.1